MLLENRFLRTEKLIGKEAMTKLKDTKVAVFGIGGVGSYVVESLARAGIGKLVLIDNDIISETNINRQIHSLTSTIGRLKVEVMKERILDINPNIDIVIHNIFYLPESSEKEKLTWDYKYIVDAIDTVTAKIDLVIEADKRNIPIISAMGAGNKLDFTKFEVSDIYKTSIDPLAKVMRKELKQRNIESLKVVYSKAEPIDIVEKKSPASISYMPAICGLMIAGEVIKDISVVD